MEPFSAAQVILCCSKLIIIHCHSTYFDFQFYLCVPFLSPDAQAAPQVAVTVVATIVDIIVILLSTVTLIVTAETLVKSYKLGKVVLLIITHMQFIHSVPTSHIEHDAHTDYHSC